jgi:hypothetical protein
MNEGKVEPEEKDPPVEQEAPRKPKESKPHTMRVRHIEEVGDGASVESMDSEEFLNQHNDLCEVCNDAGELVCCSTCNLVFHLACIRPPTSRYPPDRWCCAYCVAAGVKGHSKEARTRRRMAAAAREMTQMKNELNPDYNSEATDKMDDGTGRKKGRPPKEPKEAEDDDDEKQPAKPRRGRPPKRALQSEDMNEAKNAESEAKKAKVESDEGNSDDTEEDAEGRPRRRSRERRQPALYNPQSGPAKKWQSDGKLEWKSLGSDSDGDTDGTANTHDDTDASGKSVLCKFCHDDPSISVCCFCACRVCFGKHDKSKLLICDRCDDEYHIYCLDPPLQSVPKSMQWFCSACKDAPKEEVKLEPEMQTEPKKRRGRPPATKKSKPSEMEDAMLPKRRGRGRPPKKLVEETTDEDEPVVKRKRGRPPKKKSSPAVAKEAKASTPIKSNVGKKKRGRPPKNKNLGSSTANTTMNPSAAPSISGSSSASSQSISGVKNAPSTAKMHASTSLGGVASFPPANPPVVPSQKSRSGRTVKRNPFHDEIYEGAQLMPSHRPPVEQQKKSVASPGHPSLTSSGPATNETNPSYQAIMKHAQPAPIPNAPVPSKPPTTTTVGNATTLGTEAPGTMQDAKLPNPGTHSSFPPPVATTGPTHTYTPAIMAGTTQGALPVPPAVLAYPAPTKGPSSVASGSSSKAPRRKPGARECMQMSRRFGVNVIPQEYMETLFDYCSRGKVDHLIRMRERLDDHSRMLEAQLAGLETLVKEKGELDITVPPAVDPFGNSPPK